MRLRVNSQLICDVSRHRRNCAVLLAKVTASPLCSAHFSLAASLAANPFASALSFPKKFGLALPVPVRQDVPPLPRRSRTFTPMVVSLLSGWGGSVLRL